MDYTLQWLGIYPDDIRHAVEVADLACINAGLTEDDIDFDSEDMIFDLKCTGSWENITNSIIFSYFGLCTSAVEKKLGADNVEIDWYVNGYDSHLSIEVLKPEPSGKRALLIDYVDNMDDYDQFGLWNECAETGRVSPIEDTEYLDRDFSASELMGFDLTHFDIDDHYYYVTSDALYSYMFFYEAMDDVGGKDELIDWLMEGYDGFYDELTDFMRSEEYLQAED